MPRAKRYYLPGHIWHLTHRCHKKEFLLKFLRDRQKFSEWLFQAKKRYGIKVLNYMITSNHIHLLVMDPDGKHVIPRSMQLIAGRTGQEYNQRKNRKGAFWEDRYHATAIESDRHLIQCLVYIDLNMVRAGVVSHPSEWKFSGYNEIQNPKERYSIIEYKSLMSLLNFENYYDLKDAHRDWVESVMQKKENVRDKKWTHSVAVGTRQFVERVKGKLAGRARGRVLFESGKGTLELKESQSYYSVDNTENTLFWNISMEMPV